MIAWRRTVHRHSWHVYLDVRGRRPGIDRRRFMIPHWTEVARTRQQELESEQSLDDQGNSKADHVRTIDAASGEFQAGLAARPPMTIC